VAASAREASMVASTARCSCKIWQSAHMAAITTSSARVAVICFSAARCSLSSYLYCNTPIFGPFFFFWISLNFYSEFFFGGSVVLKPGKTNSFSSPEWLVTLTSFPRSCHFHLGPTPTFYFLGIFLFSIKGIILFALGCEATYISVLPLIPTKFSKVI
jgi:hypothetical protein